MAVIRYLWLCGETTEHVGQVNVLNMDIQRKLLLRMPVVGATSGVNWSLRPRRKQSVNISGGLSGADQGFYSRGVCCSCLFVCFCGCLCWFGEGLFFNEELNVCVCVEGDIQKKCA